MESLEILLLGDVMIGRILNIFGNRKYLAKYEKECETVHKIWAGLQRHGARYVWGDLLDSITNSHVRIANLEGVFCSEFNSEEESCYVHKIHPSNVAFLKEARINCCTLANNHVLDCGLAAVRGTVDLLTKERIKWCGFGNGQNCWRPAFLQCSLKPFSVEEQLADFKPNSEKYSEVSKALEDCVQPKCECEVSKALEDCVQPKCECEVSKALEDCVQPKCECADRNKDAYGISSSSTERRVKIAVFAIADHFREWAADSKRAGINFFDIENFTPAGGNPNHSMWRSLEIIKGKIEKVRPVVDIVIFSIHWGNNFRWVPPSRFQEFAHELIELGVDVIFGHSAHHIQGIEVYKDRFILYGCGDFLDDYQVYEQVLNMQGETFGQEFEYYKSNLSFLYKLYWKPSCLTSTEKTTVDCCDEEDKDEGKVSSGSYNLELIPVKIHNCQVNRAVGTDAQWLMSKMEELCGQFKTLVSRTTDGRLVIQH